MFSWKRKSTEIFFVVDGCALLLQTWPPSLNPSGSLSPWRSISAVPSAWKPSKNPSLFPVVTPSVRDALNYTLHICPQCVPFVKPMWTKPQRWTLSSGTLLNTCKLCKLQSRIGIRVRRRKCPVMCARLQRWRRWSPASCVSPLTAQLTCRATLPSVWKATGWCSQSGTLIHEPVSTTDGPLSSTAGSSRCASVLPVWRKARRTLSLPRTNGTTRRYSLHEASDSHFFLLLKNIK